MPSRPRLSRLSPNPAVQTPNGRGSLPKLRVRAQPEAAPPTSAGSRRMLAPLPLAGVALVILALILDLGVLAASSKRSSVLLATRTLPAGTVLTASDVRTGQLAGEAQVLAALVPGREATQVVGQRLASAIPAGTPLPSGALTGGQASSPAFVLSVPMFDAIGAKLQPGDRVTVLATFGAGSGQASTRPVARDLQVLSVGEAPANADPSTATVPVTVAVENASLISGLALANEDAKLDVLLEGASPLTAAIPQATEGSTP